MSNHKKNTANNAMLKIIRKLYSKAMLGIPLPITVNETAVNFSGTIDFLECRRPLFLKLARYTKEMQKKSSDKLQNAAIASIKEHSNILTRRSIEPLSESELDLLGFFYLLASLVLSAEDGVKSHNDKAINSPVNPEASAIMIIMTYAPLYIRLQLGKTRFS
jgi:hypothetical protein